MRITFTGEEVLDDVPALEYYTDETSPATYKSFDESMKGAAPSRKEVQTIVCNATAGTFKLSFNGETTAAAIPFTATLPDLANALDGLSTIGGSSGSVSVYSSSIPTPTQICSSDSAHKIYVKFERRTGDVPELEFNSVSDPGTTITIATVVEGVHPVWSDFFLSFRGQKNRPNLSRCNSKRDGG
jgi:hypothetical protein